MCFFLDAVVQTQSRTSDTVAKSMFLSFSSELPMLLQTEVEENCVFLCFLISSVFKMLPFKRIKVLFFSRLNHLSDESFDKLADRDSFESPHWCFVTVQPLPVTGLSVIWKLLCVLISTPMSKQKEKAQSGKSGSKQFYHNGNYWWRSSGGKTSRKKPCGTEKLLTFLKYECVHEKALPQDSMRDFISATLFSCTEGLSKNINVQLQQVLLACWLQT